MVHVVIADVLQVLLPVRVCGHPVGVRVVTAHDDHAGHAVFLTFCHEVAHRDGNHVCLHLELTGLHGSAGKSRGPGHDALVIFVPADRFRDLGGDYSLTYGALIYMALIEIVQIDQALPVFWAAFLPVVIALKSVCFQYRPFARRTLFPKVIRSLLDAA